MLRRLYLSAGLVVCLGLAPAALLAQTPGAEPTQSEQPETPTPPPAAPAPAKTEWGTAGYNKGFKLESADKQFTLRISNRIQTRFTMVDPEVGDEVGSFRIRRMKTTFEGVAFGDWKYKIQANWVGANVVSAVTQSGTTVRPTVGRGPVLEDAELYYTRNSMASPWIGQGKSFFGRQELTSSGRQQFVDRSIASDRFTGGRDQGVGLVGANEAKTWEYNLGVYNGNGINQAANDNKEFMTIGRFVWTPLGEYKLEESNLDYTGPRLLLGVAGLNNTRGTGTAETDITRLGAEVGFKAQGLNIIGEYYTEDSEPITGAALDTDGYYLQVGYLFPNRKFELAGRISEIAPDTAASQDLTETGAAVSYYFSKHDYKLQADYRILENDATNAEDKELRLQLQLLF